MSIEDPTPSPGGPDPGIEPPAPGAESMTPGTEPTPSAATAAAAAAATAQATAGMAEEARRRADGPDLGKDGGGVVSDGSGGSVGGSWPDPVAAGVGSLGAADTAEPSASVPHRAADSATVRNCFRCMGAGSFRTPGATNRSPWNPGILHPEACNAPMGTVISTLEYAITLRNRKTAEGDPLVCLRGVYA